MRTRPKVLKLETKHNACFVKGTLVHTDKGLVPIQDIKVGDMVLSRDEHNPDGDTAYKRVVSTFKSNEKKPVMAVEFSDAKLAELSNQFSINQYEVLKSGTYNDYKNYYNDDLDGKLYTQRLEEQTNHSNNILHYLKKSYQLDTTLEALYPKDREYTIRGFGMHLFCTDDHPFWVDGKGWTLAAEINEEDKLVSGIDLDLVIEMGSFTSAEECKFLYQANVPDLASYLYYDSYENYQTHLETVERFVDFRPSVPTFTYGITSSIKSLGKGYFNQDLGMTYFNTNIHPESAYHPLEAIHKLPVDIDDPEWDGIRQPYEVEKPNELQFNYGSKFHNPSQEKYDRYEAYVYNIEVEDYHTYFVGYAGVWVHNTNGCFSENIDIKSDKSLTEYITDEEMNIKRIIDADSLIDYYKYKVDEDIVDFGIRSDKKFADYSSSRLHQEIINDLFDQDKLARKLLASTDDRAKLAEKIKVKEEFCFVAGTLVHTDKGLLPIQELKIGDKVLSKDESGEGELVYKPVIRTIKSATKQKIITPVDGIYCTDNHPFWTHVYGEDKPRWVAAEFVTSNDIVHHIFPEKGRQGEVLDIFGRYREEVRDPYQIGGNYIIATSDPEVALYMGVCDDKHAGPGEINIGVVDFRNGKAVEVLTNDEDSFLGDYSYSKDGSETYAKFHKFLDKANPEHRIEIAYYSKLLEAYRVPDWENDSRAISSAHTEYVYNIEVADTHTYFVGPLGIWVHNSNCPADVRRDIEKGFRVGHSLGTAMKTGFLFE